MAGKTKRAPRHVINFRALRERSEIPVRDVARALDVAESTVRFWDAGRQPLAEYLPDLAQLFGCTIEELYGLPRPRTQR